jgi:hypothetical protein
MTIAVVGCYGASLWVVTAYWQRNAPFRPLVPFCVNHGDLRAGCGQVTLIYQTACANTHAMPSRQKLYLGCMGVWAAGAQIRDASSADVTLERTGMA